MNTTLTFPVSGQTIGTNTTSVSYTANASGNGAMVYCSAHLPSSNNGQYVATVSIGGATVARYYSLNSVEDDAGGNTGFHLVSNQGPVNILQSISIFGDSTSGGAGYVTQKHSCGFPTDRNGNAYLLLRPGQTVVISTNTSAASSLTVLEL